MTDIEAMEIMEMCAYQCSIMAAEFDKAAKSKLPSDAIPYIGAAHGAKGCENAIRITMRDIQELMKGHQA